MRIVANSLAIGTGASAAFLVVLAQGLFALTDSFAPLVAADMSIWEFQAIRAALMLPVAGAMAVLFGSWRRILAQAPRAVALRTVLNVVALGAYFAVLPLLPLGQAAAGFFTTPLWVALCLSIAGRSGNDGRLWLTVMLGFCGAALAVGVGRGGGVEPLALVPVAAGAVNAVSVLITNEHCREEDPCALLFWSIAGFLGLGLIGLGASAWLAPIGRAAGAPEILFVQPAPVDSGMLLMSAALGLSSIIGAGLLMRGYQMGENASVALFDYSYLVWAAIVSAALWGQAPTATGLAGLALIVAAGVLAVAPRRSRESAVAATA